MKFIAKKYIATLAAVFILTQLIPSFSVRGGWYGLFYACLILAIMVQILMPILNLVMLPLNLITLNLSSWIVRVGIFYLWTIIISQVKITGWQFPGIDAGPITLSAFNLVKWQVTLLLAVGFTLINKMLNWIFK